MDFLDLATSRYSVRKFSQQPVEQDKIEKLIEVALKSPSAVNMQPFKLFLCTSDRARNAIKECTPYHFDAPEVLIVAGDPEAAWTSSRTHKNYAELDAAIVATHIMLEIHDLGLGTCWVGAYDHAKLIEALPELKPYKIVGLFPFGYPAQDSKPSPKHEQSKTKDEVFSEI